MLHRLAAVVSAHRPRGDGGYTAQTVITIAALVAATATAVAIISDEIISAAESISLDGD